jgi:hypothetical protein
MTIAAVNVKLTPLMTKLVGMADDARTHAQQSSDAADWGDARFVVGIEWRLINH